MVMSKCVNFHYIKLTLFAITLNFSPTRKVVLLSLIKLYGYSWYILKTTSRGLKWVIICLSSISGSLSNLLFTKYSNSLVGWHFFLSFPFPSISRFNFVLSLPFPFLEKSEISVTISFPTITFFLSWHCLNLSQEVTFSFPRSYSFLSLFFHTIISWDITIFFL